jgi:hypothetical protein
MNQLSTLSSAPLEELEACVSNQQRRAECAKQKGRKTTASP